MPNLIQSVSKMFKDNNSTNSSSNSSKNSKNKMELHATPSSKHSKQSSKTAQRGMPQRIPSTDCEFNGSKSSHTVIERTYEMLQKSVSKLNVQPNECSSSSKKLRRTKKTKRPIFGVSLSQLELNHGKQSYVPRFVVDLVYFIERNFLRKEGLYRVSGSAKDITSLKKILDTAYDPKMFETVDANILASLLKLFFRELPESLIPPKACEVFNNKNGQYEINERLHTLIKDLPNPRRATISFLIKHFVHITTFSLENRMTAYNLATVWGPTIVWVENISDIRLTSLLIKTLIQNYELIFREIEP